MNHRTDLDLDMDFTDARGPQDTYDRLDEVVRDTRVLWLPYGTVDLDYPDVPDDWRRRHPEDNEVYDLVARRVEEAEARGVIPFQVKFTGLKWRTSPSGEGVHLEFHIRTRDKGTPPGPDRDGRPSEVMAVRQVLRDDGKRLLCDSRRALTVPFYVHGFLNFSKRVPVKDHDGQIVRKNGKAQYVSADAGPWRDLIP